MDGKVAEVQRTVGSSRKRLKFDYDAMGQRIAKHQYAGNVWEKSTYYVRDAQGNVLATYNKENPGTATMKVTERDIYGSSRVGLYKKEVEMISATTPSATAFQHETGLRQYELSNHLGNVLAVITDRKRPLDLGDYDVSGDGINDTNTSGGAADNRTDYYQAEIVMSGDYSPFGVTLDGRNFSSSQYRYAFNGMEKDDEVKGEMNSYTTEFRQYDPRLGRWLSPDPIVKHWESVYAAYANNPVYFTDPSGLNPGTEGESSGQTDNKTQAKASNNEKGRSRLTGKSNLLVFIDDKSGKMDTKQFQKRAKKYDYVIADNLEEAQKIISEKYGTKSSFIDNLVIKTHGHVSGTMVSGAQNNPIFVDESQAEQNALNYMKSLLTNDASVLLTGCGMCQRQGGESLAKLFIEGTDRSIFISYTNVNSTNYIDANKNGEVDADESLFFAFDRNLILPKNPQNPNSYWAGFKMFTWDKKTKTVINTPNFYNVKVNAERGNFIYQKMNIPYKEGMNVPTANN